MFLIFLYLNTHYLGSSSNNLNSKANQKDNIMQKNKQYFYFPKYPILLYQNEATAHHLAQNMPQVYDKCLFKNHDEENEIFVSQSQTMQCENISGNNEYLTNLPINNPQNKQMIFFTPNNQENKTKNWRQNNFIHQNDVSLGIELNKNLIDTVNSIYKPEISHKYSVFHIKVDIIYDKESANENFILKEKRKILRSNRQYLIDEIGANIDFVFLYDHLWLKTTELNEKCSNHTFVYEDSVFIYVGVSPFPEFLFYKAHKKNTPPLLIMVHKTAIIGKFFCWGNNSIIMSYVNIKSSNGIGANVIIGRNTRIGYHCIIEDNNTIMRYSKIGNFSHIYKNNFIGNNVVIGDSNTFDKENFQGEFFSEFDDFLKKNPQNIAELLFLTSIQKKVLIKEENCIDDKCVIRVGANIGNNNIFSFAVEIQELVKIFNNNFFPRKLIMKKGGFVDSNNILYSQLGLLYIFKNTKGKEKHL